MYTRVDIKGINSFDFGNSFINALKITIVVDTFG